MKYDDAFAPLPAQFAHRPGRFDELLDARRAEERIRRRSSASRSRASAPATRCGAAARRRRRSCTRIEWTVSEFKTAGLKDAAVETYRGAGADVGAAVVAGADRRRSGVRRRHADTVTLQSAFPQPGGASIPGGRLTAPVVYVGHGTDADLAGRDVERQDRRRARAAGAVAVRRRRAGRGAKLASQRRRSASSTRSKARATRSTSIRGSRAAKSPCFMIGGQDAWFLAEGDRQGGERRRARQAEDRPGAGVGRAERPDVGERRRDDSRPVGEADHRQRARRRLLPGRRRQRERPRACSSGSRATSRSSRSRSTR